MSIFRQQVKLLFLLFSWEQLCEKSGSDVGSGDSFCDLDHTIN